MDTPETASSALDTNQAAALFANILDPQQAADDPIKDDAKDAPDATPAQDAAKDDDTQKPDADPQQQDDATADADKVTIEVDGKTVELTKAELADYYKNGLRQADYTKKTMETAEQRKAAEAEISKAREERQRYAQGLNQAQAVLQAQLQEQSQTNWHQLREENPVEFLKQWHLFSERQAAFQDLGGKRQQLAAQEFQENKVSLLKHLQSEHQALLDKLPEWKDEKKAGAERQEIVKELESRGFPMALILGQTDQDGTPSLNNPGLTDHKLLLLARDAMLYRKTMAQASAAAKKVSNLPQKVERPGVAENRSLDGRSAAMRQFTKSGKVEDAARVLANLL